MKQQILLKSIAIIIPLLLFSFSVYPQKAQESDDKFELLPFGDMNTWMQRKVKESWPIGGKERIFHEIAKGETLVDLPYKNSDSPWGLSSVLAKVSGITKASYTVFPEKRGSGYAARLETRIEEVKVLGIININVLASGTIFLGEMVEPITGTSDPMSKLNAGMEFNKRPKALQYDYKVITGGKCIQSTGFGRQKTLEQKDMAEVSLYLQHRWEDANGKLYAKRVATAWENYDKSVKEWQNKHQVVISYGDISSKAFYKDVMGLKKGENACYARNSKDEMVPVEEVGWAVDNESVTHIMLQFSASNGGAYIGNTDSRFWLDNIGLVY